MGYKFTCIFTTIQKNERFASYEVWSFYYCLFIQSIKRIHKVVWWLTRHNVYSSLLCFAWRPIESWIPWKTKNPSRVLEFPTRSHVVKPKELSFIMSLQQQETSVCNIKNLLPHSLVQTVIFTVNEIQSSAEDVTGTSPNRVMSSRGKGHLTRVKSNEDLFDLPVKADTRKGPW